MLSCLCETLLFIYGSIHLHIHQNQTKVRCYQSATCLEGASFASVEKYEGGKVACCLLFVVRD
jgi:hypothetical protein